MDSCKLYLLSAKFASSFVAIEEHFRSGPLGASGIAITITFDITRGDVQRTHPF
jgi:hypothetical protein